MFRDLNFENPGSVRFPYELRSLNFFISDRSVHSVHMESGLTYSQDRKSCNQDIMISCKL